MPEIGTCDACCHWTGTGPVSVTDSDRVKWAGSCNLIDNWGDEPQKIDNITAEGVIGYEYGKALVWVGPKFGCIHWLKKA